MDVNLNPRAAPSEGLTDGSGMEEDFAMSRRCELTAKGPELSQKALLLKKAIEKKIAEGAPVAAAS